MYIGSKRIGGNIVGGDSPPIRAHLPRRVLRYPESVRLWLAACIAACAAVCAGPAQADGAAPCVATGMFAKVAPFGKVPVPIGPSLAGAARDGTTVDAFSDERTGSTLDHVAFGVAGCVDASGTPGGTALSATAWSILG